MITKEEFDAACVAKRDAQKIIDEYSRQQIDDFDARWAKFSAGQQFFTDADLIYSAGARCDKCNAGLAYPKNCGPFHQWTCSDVLKGIGTDKGHSAFPFAFYSIISEEQRERAQGATTRPQPKDQV